MSRGKDIERDIEEALGDFVDYFNVAGIIDEMANAGLVEWDEHAGLVYSPEFGPDEFWTIAQKHEN